MGKWKKFAFVWLPPLVSKEKLLSHFSLSHIAVVVFYFRSPWSKVITHKNKQIWKASIKVKRHQKQTLANRGAPEDDLQSLLWDVLKEAEYSWFPFKKIVYNNFHWLEFCTSSSKELANNSSLARSFNSSCAWLGKFHLRASIGHYLWNNKNAVGTVCLTGIELMVIGQSGST